MKQHNQKELVRKLKQFNEDTFSYLNEIKQLVSIKKDKSFYPISYFTYSTQFTQNDHLECLIIGTYHILNLGSMPINNPYICLKISPNSPFRFSGKYIHKETKLPLQLPNAWERINEPHNKEEYWLKPKSVQKMEPSEKISFSNFQLEGDTSKSFSTSVMGFTYCDESKDGFPSLNQIHISGTIDHGGIPDEPK